MRLTTVLAVITAAVLSNAAPAASDIPQIPSHVVPDRSHMTQKHINHIRVVHSDTFNATSSATTVHANPEPTRAQTLSTGVKIHRTAKIHNTRSLPPTPDATPKPEEPLFAKPERPICCVPVPAPECLVCPICCVLDPPFECFECPEGESPSEWGQDRVPTKTVNSGSAKEAEFTSLF